MSDPDSTRKKIKVMLTAEERILLVSLLLGARTRDADASRRRKRIAKALEILHPDPHQDRPTYTLATPGERAALKFEVVEIKNDLGEVVQRAPKIHVPSDRPREWRLMPMDHAHIVDFLDNLPEGVEVQSNYVWLHLIDAFDVGELKDVDDEPHAPAAEGAVAVPAVLTMYTCHICGRPALDVPRHHKGCAVDPVFFCEPCWNGQDGELPDCTGRYATRVHHQGCSLAAGHHGPCGTSASSHRGATVTELRPKTVPMTDAGHPAGG